MRRPLRVLDLYAGAGGLSAGFAAVGFDVVAAVEFDHDAASTYRHNHPRVRVAEADIRGLGREQLLELVGGSIDVVAAGPPCQGFSTNGPRDPRHPSAELLFEVARVVEALQPRAFLVENVPGLLSFRSGLVIDSFIRRVSATGRLGVQYAVVLDTLDAAGYGVPQQRRRIMICGVVGRPFKFPAPTSRRLSLIDAIGDLPEWTASTADEALTLPAANPLTPYQRARRRGATALYNHSAKRLQETRQHRLTYLAEGNDKRALPEHLQAGGRNGKYRKLRSGVPAPTIVAHMAHDTAAFVHPWYNRMLTVREAARLQAYDDRYQFFGSQYSQFRQVGNSVPVLLAAEVARAMQLSVQACIAAERIRVRSATA